MGTNDRAPDASKVETCGGTNGAAAIVEFVVQEALEADCEVAGVRRRGAFGRGVRSRETGGCELSASEEVEAAEVSDKGADVLEVLAATLPHLRVR